MAKTTTLVENHLLKIGDLVGFKCDIEQVGRIMAITPGPRGDTLELYRPDGFDGEYIGGEKTTYEDARDCWVV